MVGRCCPAAEEEQNVIGRDDYGINTSYGCFLGLPDDATLNEQTHLSLQHRDKLILVVIGGFRAVAMRIARLAHCCPLLMPPADMG